MITYIFQSDTGIRDAHYTGVHTCALPISCPFKPRDSGCSSPPGYWLPGLCSCCCIRGSTNRPFPPALTPIASSAVRRVGNDCIHNGLTSVTKYIQMMQTAYIGLYDHM